jgi:ketosteroid isomerase-like protein
MKKLLSLAAITFLALAGASLASPENEKIIQAEKDVWQTIKDKKFDAFEKFLASDFRGVYPTGINTKGKEASEIHKVDFKSYSFGDIDVVFIDKDVALLTYHVTVEGTESGKDMSGKYNAASIWKKEGNDWRVSFHTDMKAE